MNPRKENGCTKVLAVQLPALRMQSAMSTHCTNCVSEAHPPDSFTAAPETQCAYSHPVGQLSAPICTMHETAILQQCCSCSAPCSSARTRPEGHCTSSTSSSKRWRHNSRCRARLSSTRIQQPMDLIHNIATQVLRPWPGPRPPCPLLSVLGRGERSGQAWQGRSPDRLGHLCLLDGSAHCPRCLQCPRMDAGRLPGQCRPGTCGHALAFCLGSSKDVLAALAGKVAVGVGCRELLPAQPAALCLAARAPAAAPTS